MKIHYASASFLHAACCDFLSAPEPDQPSHRNPSMVAHHPLKFSTQQYDANFAAKKPSKDRKPKSTKSPEDPGFVPKSRKPFVTMPYAVNGYGTNNKGKGGNRKSNDHHHGSNPATNRSKRIDDRKQPSVYRHAPEPVAFDSCVHNEAQIVTGPRGDPNNAASQERACQKAKKKAATVKKADEKFSFDSVISTALIDNDIEILLLSLEHQYLEEIDKHIDGPDRFAKYKRMSQEECIQSATERRNYIRALLLSRLNEYLFKCSTSMEDGRQHIHYCNAASAQRLLRRFSGSFQTKHPNQPSQSTRLQQVLLSRFYSRQVSSKALEGRTVEQMILRGRYKHFVVQGNHIAHALLGCLARQQLDVTDNALTRDAAILLFELECYSFSTHCHHRW
jgi:hypothetical protein